MKKSTSKVNRLLMGIAAMAMVAAMAVAFTGCGQQQSSAPANTSASSAPAAAATDTSAAAAPAASKVHYTMKVDAADVDKGVLFEGDATVDQGLSAYDALVDSGLDLVVNATSGTAYVDGIASVVASEVGQNAGWLYSVNGEMPSVGASEYIIKDGDVIVWTFYKDAMAAM